MKQAIWNGQVLAESDETIMIEGNQYFPPDSVKREFLEENELHTVCHWKGKASYYNVAVDGQKNEAAAFYYPEPKEGSVDRVGKDFANYVSFWHGVEVK